MIEISYKSNLADGLEAIQNIVNSTTQIPFKEELHMQKENPKEFWNYILRRMVYILALFKEVELLSITAEFMKDDNGKIWLTFAKDIITRPINQSSLDMYHLLNT